MAIVHASCIAIGSCGVLLMGPSGAGKSDLALRLIDGGAVLVADDQVALRAEGSALHARPPDALAGRMEIRGIGIVTLAWRAPVTVGLAVELLAHEPPRLPEAAVWRHEGIDIAQIAVAAFTASAAAKVRLAVSSAANDSAVAAARAARDAEAR